MEKAPGGGEEFDLDFTQLGKEGLEAREKEGGKAPVEEEVADMDSFNRGGRDSKLGGRNNDLRKAA